MRSKRSVYIRYTTFHDIPKEVSISWENCRKWFGFFQGNAIQPEDLPICKNSTLNRCKLKSMQNLLIVLCNEHWKQTKIWTEWKQRMCRIEVKALWLTVRYHDNFLWVANRENPLNIHSYTSIPWSNKDFGWKGCLSGVAKHIGSHTVLGNTMDT